MKSGVSLYESIALVLVGIGFFLYGMRLIAGTMRLLSSPRMRRLLARWTGNTWLGMLFGFITGSISQSGSQSSLIMANLVSTRLIRLRDAIPIVAAANVGTVLIVFLISINIKVAILFLVGLTAIFYSLKGGGRERPLLSILLGIGLLLFGFQMLKTGVHPLMSLPSVKALPEHIGGGLMDDWIPFLVGALLRLLAQSTSTVIVIAVSFSQVAGMQLHQAMFMIFGAVAGSAVSTWVLAGQLKGTSKQLAFYQMVYDLSGCVIMTVCLIVEMGANVPLFKSLTEHLSSAPAQQLAYVFLSLRLVSFGSTMSLRGPIVRLLERLSPPTRGELLSKPEFINDEAAGDPMFAVDLVGREQQRILARMPVYLEKLRDEHDVPEFMDCRDMHPMTVELGRDITHFMREVMNGDLSRETAEEFLIVQNRQDLIMMLEETVYKFSSEMDTWKTPADMLRVRTGMIESLHAVLSTVADTAASDDASDLDHLLEITADRRGIMERMRQVHLSEDSNVDTADRASLLYVTDLFQRIVWLLNQWARLGKVGALK
jgi:phosphate:Na+ symporter